MPGAEVQCTIVGGSVIVSGKSSRYLTDNDSFSAKLRRLRMGRTPHLSQARIARQLGVTRATYASYEAGRRAVPFWFACAAASYFQVPIEELTENDERNSDI